MPSKKSPNPIDIHVGSRVRLRRMMLGMSQEKRRASGRGDEGGRRVSKTNRAQEIAQEIARLQGELKGLAPIDVLGVRELSRVSGVSPSTISRVRNGEEPSMRVAKELLPYLKTCPCCGKALETIDG